MNRWRRGFEVAMWNSRLVAVFAVIPSIVVGMALFCINAIESLRVLPALLRFADPTMAMDQREALLKQGLLREISVIDGFLLGAFMLIFGFGIYELFLGDLQAARSSEASGRILHINSLDDLKTRLAKVILIILIVETFKDAFGVKAQTPLDLLYVGATIALIGLALYLTHGSRSDKNAEAAPAERREDHP